MHKMVRALTDGIYDEHVHDEKACMRASANRHVLEGNEEA